MDIAPGIEHVTDTINGYDFTLYSSGQGYYSPGGTSWNHWGSITSEIDAGRPLVWTVWDYTVPEGNGGNSGHEVDHSVAVVGYKKWTSSKWYWPFTKWACWALVHNTWDRNEHYWMVLKRSQWTGGFFYDECYSDHCVKVIPGCAGKIVGAPSNSDIVLGQNTPNPFNPATSISFAITQREPITLSIYNSLGQEINVLVNGEMDAGFHSIVWNGKDSSGDDVSSGVYFYRLETPSACTMKKMMLLR